MAHIPHRTPLARSLSNSSTVSADDDDKAHLRISILAHALRIHSLAQLVARTTPAPPTRRSHNPPSQQKRRGSKRADPSRSRALSCPARCPRSASQPAAHGARATGPRR
ncbi:hypothetical protein C8Q80DRAFT_1202320 [Daedaleopsis nitida]|nr:hypothetical protein C8Q80DRAFT_1202320 [Daedaleopsis nitida]